MWFRQGEHPRGMVPVYVPQQSPVKRAMTSIVIPVIIAVLVAAVGMVIVNEVWRYITNLEEFRISPQAVKIDLPPWAKPELEREIRKGIAMRGQYSIFQPGLAARIAQEYEKSPWITRVVSARKELPNRIVMEIILRKPIARVMAGGKTYLIDKDCVLLPEELFRWKEEEGTLPLVRVSDDTYPCTPGREWRDESVRAGIGLISFLKTYGLIKKLRIATVDINNTGRPHERGLCEIYLTNANGTIIKWGRFSNELRPGEVPNEVKLQNLLTAVKYRGYDLAGLEYVDVRWDNPYEKRLSFAAGNGRFSSR